ncbi:actin-binding protein ipp-like [Gigaspora margarita]|uniref:Actin-binding protein ipp-like n=1 Tax=Gigaspora margarita TaxID=4874 RepID=A0A8H4EKZ7_GIGMA|nr:actin-binding protein ipp-like [Gigaspora margarita]
MRLEFVNAVKNESVLYFSVPELINKWFGEEQHALSLFICLDTSGSMTNAIEQAKDAILQIIERLLNENVLSENDITCFFYESTCKELRFSDLPEMSLANGEIKKRFDNVKSGGGTSFVNVFNSIVNNLNRINNDLAIIFFTDGNDNSLNERNKNHLKEALSKVPYGTEVHSIGFTKDHDARLLSWLTKCGSKAGNFLYVKTSDEIQNMLDTTLPLLKLRKRTLHAKIGDQKSLPVYLDDNGIGILNFVGEIENQRVVISKSPKSQTEHEFKSLHKMPVGDPIGIQLIIQFVQEKIIELMNEILRYENNQRHAKCQQFLADVDLLSQQLDSISNHRYDVEDTKFLINMFKNILTREKFTNDEIAEFNNFAYRKVASRRLGRRDGKSIVIPHKNGTWNGQEIYQGSYSKIELGIYKKYSEFTKEFQVAVKHFDSKINVNKMIRELRKHRNLWNANIKNVITFYGVVRKPNDKICLVMEYMENGNLHDYLSKNQLDWNFKAQWVIDISRGLLACHEYGIAHLDMKAKNIFVDYNLTLKIADFGFSYMRPGSNIEYENGSLQWASPEYISDESNMKEYYKDQPYFSDIYSYGLVAWEILTNGKEPYDDMSSDEIKKAKLSKNIGDLVDELKENDAPGVLRKIVEKCCNYNPPDRIALEEVELLLSDFK